MWDNIKKSAVKKCNEKYPTGTKRSLIVAKEISDFLCLSVVFRQGTLLNWFAWSNWLLSASSNNGFKCLHCQPALLFQHKLPWEPYLRLILQLDLSTKSMEKSLVERQSKKPCLISLYWTSWWMVNSAQEAIKNQNQQKSHKDAVDMVSIVLNSLFPSGRCIESITSGGITSVFPERNIAETFWWCIFQTQSLATPGVNSDLEDLHWVWSPLRIDEIKATYPQRSSASVPDGLNHQPFNI